ncbi:CHAT domain-containing protein [Mycena vulgaris]|nr:CHAT domain-containing protein [Mycena vulgaris]
MSDPTDSIRNGPDDDSVQDPSKGNPEYAGLGIQKQNGETQLEHPDLSKYSVKALIERYRSLKDLAALLQAVRKSQQELDLAPEGDPHRAECLQNHAFALAARYDMSGDLNDLEAALQNDQEAVDLTPKEDPGRPDRLKGLAVVFGKRYQKLGNLEDLEATLRIYQETVDLTAKGDPDRRWYLQDLAVSCRLRYQRLGDLKDLEATLQNYQEAADLTAEGHSELPGCLHDLAVSFLLRYLRLGDPKDLEAALRNSQRAVELTPEGHLDRGRHLHGLTGCLHERYRRFKDLNDLDAVLQHSKTALDLTPAEHPDRASHLQNIGIFLGDRYRRSGELMFLEDGLQYSQQAVDLTPAGHPEQVQRLRSLAVSLGERYRRLGDVKDLEAALRNNQQAVDLTATGHPERSGCLQGLAISLGQRYQRLGDVRDLGAAVQNSEEALRLVPEGHLDRENCLQTLSVALRSRYKRLGDPKDLEAALEIKQQAAKLLPEGHPYRIGRLRSLAVSFADRYKLLGDMKDLETALQISQAAIGLTEEGHPERAHCLQVRALWLSDRYRKLGELNDLDAIHQHYVASLTTNPSNPETSWRAALEWASFAQEFQSSYCTTAYAAAFHLLPEILWMGHPITVRHEAIEKYDVQEITSRATRTCINLASLPAAVEIMEQGLATTFQQILQLKPNVDGLRVDQAERLRQVSSQLHSGTSENAMNLAIERKALLEDIRKQPGLEHFLLPKPYSILCHASQGGPIVILNSHEDSCDAIVILDPASEPVHVPLPDVTLKELQSQRSMLKDLLGYCNVRVRGQSESSRLFGHREGFKTRSTEKCFEDLLTWLWDSVVGPVYQVLKSHGIHHGRLWWLPTGGFTGLPLHASSPTDPFIHSYTATLGSLLDSYSKNSSNIADKFGVVGVTHTGPGRMNALNGVRDEIHRIIPVIKKPVECLEGEQATVDAVKEQLQNCSWLHLACHGKQDLAEPTKSHLLLYGGILELETILQTPLSQAQFVFLAACQTAMGDAELVNESFHLGGGFIAAGFRGAIGTLWSMNDSDGPLVAESVYSHIFRDGREPQASDAAEALQLAVKGLKARKVKYERWIPFIHMGI